MLEPKSSLQSATDVSVAGRTMPRARVAGYGNSLAALPAAYPRATANRVTYTYPGLTEWYRNGPLGLEQGFTIARVRAGRANAPLTLSFALSGAKRVTLGSRGQSLA